MAAMKPYKVYKRGSYSPLDRAKLGYLVVVNDGYFPGDRIKKQLIKELIR